MMQLQAKVLTVCMKQHCHKSCQFCIKPSNIKPVQMTLHLDVRPDQTALYMRVDMSTYIYPEIWPVQVTVYLDICPNHCMMTCPVNVPILSVLLTFWPPPWVLKTGVVRMAARSSEDLRQARFPLHKNSAEVKGQRWLIAGCTSAVGCYFRQVHCSTK